MASRPTRREFFKTSLQASAGLYLSGLTTSTLTAQEPVKPPYQISLAQWSLHRTLRTDSLDNLDFARAARDDYGIEAVEYVNQFFKDKAKDTAYINQMKKRAADAGVENLLIMIDGEGALGAAEAAQRTQAIENHYKWVEAAKALDCHSIRVNAQSSGSYAEQMERAADGLRRLTEFADDYGINVIVENHGGLSSNGQWLAGVIQKVDHERCGTLPDFGNFRLRDGKQYDRYQGVRELMPYAKAVSAKSYDFDEQGRETQIDYMRMMKIVTDAGYHGWVGIEYEGSRLSEPEGIKATKVLLERVRTRLTS